MEEYTPPIKERDNQDLIEIYISPKGEWQDDAIKQATEELLKRGLTFDELNKITSDFKKFQEEEERKLQERLAVNATESYSLIKMIAIFFGAPIIFSGKFRNIVGLSCTDLRLGNYKIKFRQRLLLLIFGGLFWLILLRLSMTIKI